MLIFEDLVKLVIHQLQVKYLEGKIWRIITNSPIFPLQNFSMYMQSLIIDKCPVLKKGLHGYARLTLPGLTKDGSVAAS